MLFAAIILMVSFIVPIEKFTDDRGNTFEGNNLNLENNTLTFGSNQTDADQILRTVCGLSSVLVPDLEYQCHKA